MESLPYFFRLTLTIEVRSIFENQFSLQRGKESARGGKRKVHRVCGGCPQQGNNDGSRTQALNEAVQTPVVKERDTQFVKWCVVAIGDWERDSSVTLS